MTTYKKEELEEAQRAIVSTIGKCEKAILKLTENSAQHTLLSRRIKAFRISVELIERELSQLSFICLALGMLLLSSCSKKLQTKESFGDIRKAEIAARQKKSKKELDKPSPINEDYAVQLINNANSSYYPKKSGALICLKGKELIKIFEDSARTKKSNMELETLYDENGLTKRSATYMDKVLFSESVYYRNRYHLIDSIVDTDKNGLKTRSAFKYRKDQYAIISIDGKNMMTSKIFYLNHKFQCIKSETFNFSGDLVGTSLFKYDDSGRIMEEINETQKMIYQYQNPQADFYASIKFYNIKNGAFLTENLRYEDKDKTVFISKNADQVFSRTVSLNNSNGCNHIVYNYNADNKITQVYEYHYEN